MTRLTPSATVLTAILAATLLSLPVQAAGTPDPDWPCIQRRQPQMSLAQVWSGPVPDATVTALSQSPEVQGIASRIAQRRMSLEDAETQIADFAASHDAPARVALFLATFDHIQTTRSRVMEGITRYAHKQAGMDSRINDLRHRFDALNAASPQDFDAIDKLETEIDWSTRIFQDRQQALTYVCETPVILEQRAFALGKAIAAHLQD